MERLNSHHAHRELIVTNELLTPSQTGAQLGRLDAGVWAGLGQSSRGLGGPRRGGVHYGPVGCFGGDVGGYCCGRGRCSDVDDSYS